MTDDAPSPEAVLREHYPELDDAQMDALLGDEAVATLVSIRRLVDAMPEHSETTPAHGMIESAAERALAARVQTVLAEEAVEP